MSKGYLTILVAWLCIIFSFIEINADRQINNFKDVGPLIGFSGESVWTTGEVTHPIYAEEVNLSIIFQVVEAPSTYNVILERPWIHAMRAISFTYHQVIKFPTL